MNIINVFPRYCSIFAISLVFHSARSSLFRRLEEMLCIKWLWMLLIQLLAYNFNICEVTSRSLENQHTNLDILTTDYLVMENHLWSTIKNGQNRDNTLEHIYSVHQMNFEQNFGDVGIFWEYHLNEHRDLLEDIAAVNQTSSVCLTFLKSQNRRDVNELLNAVSNVRIVAERIYAKCTNAEFWEFIRQVGVELM